MKTAWFLIVVGLLLGVIGMIMRAQQSSWIEKQTQIVHKDGNKGTAAMVGAGAGAAVGAGAGAAIGGIGIVAMGTGIGIPVGIVMVSLGAILAGGGAGIGYMMGEEAHDIEQVVGVVQTAPTYNYWLWGSVLFLAATIFLVGCFRLIILIFKSKEA